MPRCRQEIIGHQLLVLQSPLVGQSDGEEEGSLIVPQFTPISPTSVPGKKEYAWRTFLQGGYAAIGWLSHADLTGNTLDGIERLLEGRF